MKNILTKNLRCLRQNGVGLYKTCADAILPKGHAQSVFSRKIAPEPIALAGQLFNTTICNDAPF